MPPKKTAPTAAQTIPEPHKDLVPPASADPAVAPQAPQTPTKKRKAAAPKTKTPTPKKAKKLTPKELKAEDEAGRNRRYQPLWGQRRDCPLLDKLHADILDRIFTPDNALELRDWLSLSGVNTYFRDQLNDEVFKELHSIPGLGPYHRSKKGIRGLAYRAFTQDITPWREAHPVDTGTAPEVTWYHPEGLRPWTEVEYARYKEDKHRVITAERTRRGRQDDALAFTRSQVWRSDKYQKRTIMYEGAEWKTNSVIAGVKPEAVLEKEGEEIDEDALDKEDPAVWFKNPGDRKLGEYWPSPWRTKCAAFVNNNWMKKGDILSKFTAKEDQLKTIKHAVLIIPTGGIHTTKAHAYQVAAVKALIISSRGGYEGYLEHLKDVKIKAETKAANAAKAIAEGRPPPGTRKVTPKKAPAQASPTRHTPAQGSSHRHVPNYDPRLRGAERHRAIFGYEQFEQYDPDD